MARIKHIAIRTPDPEKTAAFYKDVFGLKEVGQARTGCYLSDGYINLAILKAKDDGDGESPRDVPGYGGIHHFGFMGDDGDAGCRKLDEAGGTALTNAAHVRPRPRVVRAHGPRAGRPGDRRHGDPLDQRIARGGRAGLRAGESGRSCSRAR